MTRTPAVTAALDADYTPRRLETDYGTPSNAVFRRAARDRNRFGIGAGPIRRKRVGPVGDPRPEPPDVSRGVGADRDGEAVNYPRTESFRFTRGNNFRLKTRTIIRQM